MPFYMPLSAISYLSLVFIPFILAITMPLKCRLVKLFFISRDLNISAGERKHKRMKKTKAEGSFRLHAVIACQFCSQHRLISRIILRTCKLCQQLLRDTGQGILVLSGLAWLFKLWHVRSEREPRKQKEVNINLSTEPERNQLLQ